MRGFIAVTNSPSPLQQWTYFQISPPLLLGQTNLSCDGCLEVRGEIRSVLCCIVH